MVTIHVPSVPRFLRITQTMWEDLICDPVKAAFVIFGYELDAFQGARLRYYWWCLEVIDSSGFSSGKTLVDWLFLNLRCILLPEHEVGVYYPVFDTGKRTFWTYFKKCRHKIFKAQLGGTDEKGDEENKTSRGPACWLANYKNGSKLSMPAPSFVQDANTQASLRYHDLLVEEWTHIDASGSEGIDKQLKGRVTMESWNQHHPIWGNHIILTAPAKTRSHPGNARFRKFERRVNAGDPRCAALHYCFKDYSNRPMRAGGKTFKEALRVESTLNSLRNSLTPTDWLGEGLGHWGASGRGWFTEEAWEAAQKAGARSGLLPVLSRTQFEEECRPRGEEEMVTTV